MDGSEMGFQGASSTFPAPQGHPNPAARSRRPPSCWLGGETCCKSCWNWEQKRSGSNETISCRAVPEPYCPEPPAGTAFIALRVPIDLTAAIDTFLHAPRAI